MKVQRLFFTFLLTVGALMLSGCYVNVINLTPDTIPQNPSGVYTLSMTPRITNSRVMEDTMKVEVVINGEAREMERSDTGNNVFVYDYELPGQANRAKYYYIVTYQLETSTGAGRQRTVNSQLYDFELANRYVVTLESNRAPVGAQIPVLGRGFTRSDSIVVGPVTAKTRFVSQNLLEFTVPGLEPGKSYPVIWQSGFGEMPIGDFRIDSSQLSVLPARIDIPSGRSLPVLFRVDFPAPEGGLPIDVTTDIPESIIMPEVVIPEGQSTVNVLIEGGAPGAGSLFVNVDGMPEYVVPVNIRPAVGE
ncbi:MAG: IPT/TIG domain-containing protein [Opitutales bacterium]